MYSVKQVIYLRDEKRNVIKSHYITLGRGLTWQAAKELRKANRNASIVRERAQ